jgi:hypothetical protein
MNRNKELNDLVERLKRIFPHLRLYYEGEYLENEDDFAPPCEYDWYEFIKILKENGLTIKNIKENEK